MSKNICWCHLINLYANLNYEDIFQGCVSSIDKSIVIFSQLIHRLEIKTELIEWRGGGDANEKIQNNV